jgi:hypothetical protein
MIFVSNTLADFFTKEYRIILKTIFILRYFSVHNQPLRVSIKCLFLETDIRTFAFFLFTRDISDTITAAAWPRLNLCIEASFNCDLWHSVIVINLGWYGIMDVEK